MDERTVELAKNHPTAQAHATEAYRQAVADGYKLPAACMRFAGSLKDSPATARRDTLPMELAVIMATASGSLIEKLDECPEDCFCCLIVDEDPQGPEIFVAYYPKPTPS